MYEGSGLALWDVVAKDALITLHPPRPIWSILKPLGDAGLGMNCAIHHRNAGLIAVGDNLFQANLTVAQKCDEGHEHEISIQ